LHSCEHKLLQETLKLENKISELRIENMKLKDNQINKITEIQNRIDEFTAELDKKPTKPDIEKVFHYIKNDEAVKEQQDKILKDLIK
jgi:DNA-binding protein H-NS